MTSWKGLEVSKVRMPMLSEASTCIRRCFVNEGQRVRLELVSSLLGACSVAPKSAWLPACRNGTWSASSLSYLQRTD